MLRNIISTAIMLVLVLSFLPVIHADYTPQFKVENKLFITPKGEPAPYINKDQRTMGSLRLVANALGVSNSDVSWDNATQTAKLTKGERTVEVTVGKKELKVNGEVVVMDTKAEMKLGRVFIPARFIGESLGWYVGYDSLSKSVLFSQSPINEQPTNNIEEIFDFTVKEQLPITTTVSGLEFTLHEVYIMDYDSEEAKALQDKYEFEHWESIPSLRRKEKPNLKAYLVRSKVTLKNSGTTPIKFGYDTFEQHYFIMTGKGVDAIPTRAMITKEYSKPNNKEVLDVLNIAPDESVTSYYYTIINDYKEMTHFKIQIGNKNNYSPVFILAD